jgi:hypothetical protein
MSGQANLRLTDECECLSSRSWTAQYHGRAALVAELDARERARRDRAVDRFLQVSIALLTLAAIGLVTSASEYARWGHVVGLLSQPFYLAATRRARQWGMYVVALALCGLWLRGIVLHFF